jgi:uncharacterized membrane protein
MKPLFAPIFRKETLPIVLALIFASVTSVALIAVRVVLTRNISYGFLVWNLALAWMPLVFALLAREQFERRTATGDIGHRQWKFQALAGAWLLFLPNAPYIFTDLIHLWMRFYGHFWIDLTLILLCAVTGLVLGFVSLFLMQSLVARIYGKAVSWLFVVVAAGLSSIGVYLGRFLRFNSWDIMFKPVKLYRGLDGWVDGRATNMSAIGFMVSFSMFLFVAYVMLYALTHLPRGLIVQIDTEAKA